MRVTNRRIVVVAGSARLAIIGAVNVDSIVWDVVRVSSSHVLAVDVHDVASSGLPVIAVHRVCAKLIEGLIVCLTAGDTVNA